MARLTPQEAGRKGGLKGGKSRSEAKLAAARRNGFQKQEPTPEKVPTERAPIAVLIAAKKEPGQQ